MSRRRFPSTASPFVHAFSAARASSHRRVIVPLYAPYTTAAASAAMTSFDEASVFTNPPIPPPASFTAPENFPIPC